jgi:hypothetical protein
MGIVIRWSGYERLPFREKPCEIDCEKRVAGVHLPLNVDMYKKKGF